MEELEITKFVQDTLLLTKCKFFVHIKRGRGIGSARKEDILSFPKMCAMCGSEQIQGTIGIGRSQLYLFTNVGDVSYCKKHYILVSALQENHAFTYGSILGISFAICLLAIIIFGPASMEWLKGSVSLIILPVFILTRYVANRRFRRKLGMDEDEERLLQPLSFGYYASMFVALALTVVGYFTKSYWLYILSFVFAVQGFLLDQAKKRTAVDEFVEANDALRQGAAQILIIRPKFYTIGLVNVDFYIKFMELNREKVISSIEYDLLRQERNVT